MSERRPKSLYTLHRVCSEQPPDVVCVLLQGRMSDTNRNLTAKTLLLLGDLAKAMGPAFDSVGRPLLSVSVSNLSDTKSQVSP